MKQIFSLLVLFLCIGLSRMVAQSDTLSVKDTVKSDRSEMNRRNFRVTLQTMPEFPGGEKALFEYLRQNVKYPIQAAKEKAEGRVIVTFVIDKKGDIRDVTVVRGVHPLLDEEAVRVVKGMPTWEPGTLEGKPVKVKYTLPIAFKKSLTH